MGEIMFAKESKLKFTKGSEEKIVEFQLPQWVKCENCTHNHLCRMDAVFEDGKTEQKDDVYICEITGSINPPDSVLMCSEYTARVKEA